MLERAPIYPCWEITRTPRILKSAGEGLEGLEAGAECKPRRRRLWGFRERCGSPP